MNQPRILPLFFCMCVGYALSVCARASSPVDRPDAQFEKRTGDPAAAGLDAKRTRSGPGMPHAEFARLDLEELAREDAQRAAQGLPPRYAVVQPTDYSPDNTGGWVPLIANSMRWQFRVSAANATSINLGFTRFHLPEGGSLVVRSADRSAGIRPFTHRDNRKHGQLWTPPLPSDDVVITATVPVSGLGETDIELGSIGIGYRGFGQAVALSGSCNVDVVCPEGAPWRDQIRSVAVLSLSGETVCSGFLVNNTALDRTPYLITAAHCGVLPLNAASLVAIWNFENSSCRPPGSPESGGPGDGVLTQFATGAEIKATYIPSDMTLVELSSEPNPAWNVVYAGWDHSGNDATSAVCVHHPNSEEKRITFENDMSARSSYLGFDSPGDGTHIRIDDWDLGSTEDGSSGSPLFDQNGRVIGQLHGGFASCSNSEPDWYGSFQTSWQGGGTPPTRLRDWLDPIDSSATTLDLFVSGGLQVNPRPGVAHIGAVGGPFTNLKVVYTLTNPTDQPLNYVVWLSVVQGILLNGSTEDVAGVLDPNGGGAVLQITLDPSVWSAPAGVQEVDVVFDDLTHGITRVRRHTIEIGQTLFSVDPEEAFVTGGPHGGPFLGSKVYTIRNERPTPLDVVVAVTQPWLTLDGGFDPLQIHLADQGESSDVTVAVAAAANTLSPGVYNADVIFTNATGGGDTSRIASLDVGRFVYRSADTPLSIDDETTVTSTIEIPDEFCVADVDVEVLVDHTWVGDIIAELSHDGRTVGLIHRPGVPETTFGCSGDNYDIVLDDDGTGGPIEDLCSFDDSQPNPISPPNYTPDQPLAQFGGENASGTWTLTLSDNAVQDPGVLQSWGLRIAPSNGADCNNNGVSDTCDIALGSSDDCNSDGIPDECQCLAIESPQLEAGGIPKNRYLSLIPSKSSCDVAMEVTLATLPAEFAAYEGSTLWVGPAFVYPESTNGGDFVAAALQCDPYTADWSGIDVLNIFGSGVVPEGVYEVRAIHAGCLNKEAGPTAADFSSAVPVATGPWGDVVTPQGGVLEPSFLDILGVVNQFRSHPDAPGKASTQLQPDTPDPALPVSFSDILAAVNAFRRMPYPYSGPVGCP